VAEMGLPVVHAYMYHIQAAAEGSVRGMLRERAVLAGITSGGVGTLFGSDRMDDGSPINLALTLDSAAGTAIFDFSGTGPQVWGNTNAPRAVTYSAVLYCLRCLVGMDIPLNQGALTPCRIIIPEGSILHPAPTAAVVGGNVLTSQRVVDVILRAFGAAAASSGCMNNLTFGDAAFGFYETICGGAGAGPGWHGASGVHTHMTNTRITDPEVSRVVVTCYCVRRRDKRPFLQRQQHTHCTVPFFSSSDSGAPLSSFTEAIHSPLRKIGWPR